MKLGDPNEGSLKNNNLYNDKELFDDADLDWYDYGFRNYDPQIGRFPQLDPLTDDYPELTPYQYASNEPIANVDMDRLEAVPANVLNDFFTVGGKVEEKALPGLVFKGISKSAQAAKSSSNILSKLGGLLSKSGSALLDGAKGFLTAMNERAKVNISKDISWIKNTANQLNANAKANWASGNTLIQQFPQDFIENPLEFLEGGAELDVLKGVGVESESLLKYEVGTANDLLSRSIKGDGLDIHHVSQSKPASQLIEGYERSKAPAIALPSAEHKAIPTLRGTNTAGTARQQLAKDIKDLRKYTNTPNNKLKQLIDLNKETYPTSFMK